MAVVFVIALIVSDFLMNKGSTDMTQEMGPASLPIIYMNVNDEYVNPIHGYTVEMDGNYLRGSITPLMANRSISFKADLYDAVVTKVGYEVRPLDMSRLIEDTDIPDYTFENNVIYATANLKDLIDDNSEYMLIIKLTTSAGYVIRYYVRVINRAELYLTEKMNFVKDFSQKTFNRDAAEELKTYMESNAEGDNSSYAYVNIHSNFRQLTWGDLNPVLKTGKDLEIIEIDENSASIMLKYQVEIQSKIHNVTEFFRILRGDKRIYLMEYERKMNQEFDEEKNVVVNGKIIHGIVSPSIERIENENGSIYAFVQQNGLFSYNIASNKIARLFEFYDKEHDDVRTRYNAHGIKPLELDSSGNARFIVYGYMNRGTHEGQSGVALYYYDSVLNTIEEELFIPYTKSYEVLKQDIERLAYVSQRGIFYILLDGTVYSINIGSRAVTVMQDSISETSFYSSDNQDMIAWQNGESVQDYNEIELYRLETLTPTKISAGSGEIVVPLGFMESDIIYGKAYKKDVTTDDTGRTLIPMYCICIQDENGNLLKTYRQEGIYVLDIEMQDNMIVLKRVSRDPETDELIETEDDQIVNNKTEKKMRNVLSSVVTEDTETTYQTVLCKEPGTSGLKTTNPKEIVYEGSRAIELTSEDKLTRYYVYAKGSLDGIYTDAADAVNESEQQNGVVVNNRMAYIWESENRKAKTELVNLDIEQKMETISNDDDQNSQEDDDEESLTSSVSSYAECLDIMLKADGIYKDTYAQLREKSVINVLRDNLDADVLELTGCDLSSVLYYISRGYPVMALTGNGQAVLIVGYDAKNTIIYDPIEMKKYKMGMNDSKEWFEKKGNRFITFVN